MAITDAEIMELSERGYLPLLKKKVVLTDSQIKGLSVPIEIVPAPGANKINVFQSAMILKSPDFISYTDIGAGAVAAFGYSPNSSDYDYESTIFKEVIGYGAKLVHLLGSGNIPGVFFIPAAPGGFVDGWGYQANASSIDPENQPIKLGLMDNGGDLTGGDPANSLTITVVYTVVDIS